MWITALQKEKSKQKVTEMGTYATQSALSVTVTPKSRDDLRPALLKFFMEGNFTLSSSLATALTKLALRFKGVCNDTRKQNVRTGHSDESVI